MMARFIRVALFWLSLFALPLHGMAGVATLACPADGGVMLPMAGMEGQAASVWSDVQAHDPMVANALDELGISKANCIGESVCQASAALPALHVEAPSAMPASAPARLVPASLIRFVTGGPDRPPRRTFA